MTRLGFRNEVEEDIISEYQVPEMIHELVIEIMEELKEPETLRWLQEKEWWSQEQEWKWGMGVHFEKLTMLYIGYPTLQEWNNIPALNLTYHVLSGKVANAVFHALRKAGYFPKMYKRGAQYMVTLEFLESEDVWELVKYVGQDGVVYERNYNTRMR